MIKIHIRHEFDKLQKAIVHDASNAASLTMAEFRQLLPPQVLEKHPETGPIYKERLIEQHVQYLAFLQRHGVELIFVEPQPQAFVQLFTRDPSFVVGDTFFISRMRNPRRVLESEGLTEIRTQQVKKVIDLREEAPAEHQPLRELLRHRAVSRELLKKREQGPIIEGGDVMVLGDVVLVGNGQTTNEAGYLKLRHHLKAQGYEKVVRVPHHALHLDCALAPLPNGEALFSTVKLPPASREILNPYFKALTAAEPEESERFLALNLLWLNHEEVISNVVVKNTNQYLRAKGFIVHELDLSQHISTWGSFRCATCPIVRE